MSTAIIAPQEQTAPPQLDSKAYIAARNSGKPAAEARETATRTTEAAPVEVKAETPKEPHVSRSVRRQLNAAIREAAEARGKLAAFEEMRDKSTKPADTPKEETEPRRTEFPAGEVGTAEFLRATQKWDKLQETKAAGRTQAETQQLEELKAFLGEMDQKAEEAMKSLADWDKVQAAAAVDEDAPEFVPSEHPTLMALLARSDMRAFLLYHFAKPENYDTLQSLLDEKNDGKLISSFHRLEGRLEKLYDSSKASEKTPVAAQASPEKDKDRTHLAEAPTGPGEPQREVPAKPKPSSEVAARGGSPAPDEPRIGSPEWMAKRNQRIHGH